MSRLRTIGLVAGFDLYESLRSKKAIALMLIYMVIAIGGTALFSSMLNRAFEQLDQQLGQAGTAQLLESEQLVKLVSRVVGDDEALARELLSVPPLALFYGWLATYFMPLIVVLTSADAISNEIGSGSARFALFRVDRLGWAGGKLLGQTLLMMLGIVVGGMACWAMGMAMLDRIAAGDTAWWLLRMSFRASFYGFAYLGIAICASQLVRSNAAARGAGIGLAFLASFVGGVLGAEPVRKAAPELFDALRQLFPNAHNLALFRPELSERLVGIMALVAIGLAWFGLGFWRFSRRDA